jgi:acyl-CoA thioesterase-1
MVLFVLGLPPSALGSDGELPGLSAQPPRVLFLGDSLTAGYGVGILKSYPTRVKEIAEESGRPIDIVNAGVSGDTSAGGVRRISSYLNRDFDVLVLALGANDALRGLTPEALEQNLRLIIDRFLEKSPKGKVLLAGMRAPPNLGEEYGKGIFTVYQKLGVADERISYLPFLLEGVAGDPAMNLADRIHPNEDGHQVIARRVWAKLEPLLRHPSS